ncbi:hypothetical protein PLIIFM63780_001204 [Purpureocillium lilacinum]|nr:hypothetical protein PLIIFM63780_001204 [Purpureocillium lilacinum]
MALEPGSGALGGSPESSGRNSPIPRQWRNQLGGEESQIKDKAYRRYASGVEKALSLFETALEEWADYISFLNRLLKALQARPSSVTAIPLKATVAKRLSQCLNPSLPSGVHQKALEVYNYIFATIGKDGLSRDLPLYLPGLAPTLSFASLSVRSPFLDLLEAYFLQIDPRSLRPAMKSIILALLPGLEDETSEDFDRTLTLVASFKKALRPEDSELLSTHHSSSDDFFWQCFFLASITSQSRRGGALAYLVRFLPALGRSSAAKGREAGSPPATHDESPKISALVTTPEPGLLVRCFATGLADDQLLIQRGFLDLLVSHLPLNSTVLQSRVKPADLELLVKAAAGVVTRRDMSLNRRLWTWLLGPEPVSSDGDPTGDLSTAPSDQQQAFLSSRTTYFEDFGLQPLTKALLHMISGSIHGNAVERARPYRICLSLMDRWEIGGLIVPEVFLPVVESVRQFQDHAPSKSEFSEVLRSASVFFDGIESGLIYSELVGLLAQAIGPGSLSLAERRDKVSLVNFIITNFNVREEEMITIHAPLTCVAALAMLEDSKGRKARLGLVEDQLDKLSEDVLGVVAALLELVPERAFPSVLDVAVGNKTKGQDAPLLPNTEILKRIQAFYVHGQGNLEGAAIPFNAVESGELLLQKAVSFICNEATEHESTPDLSIRVRILILVLLKTPTTYTFGATDLLSHLKGKLMQEEALHFSYFSSVVQLATQLHSNDRIAAEHLSGLVAPLVRHAWHYLSASDPKYHVETVRCLWQLQTSLTPSARDIEASLSAVLVDRLLLAHQPVSCAAEAARTFGVLWSHTLQDSASDRRGSRTQLQDYRPLSRLAGMDHYQVMLAQPLFLVLDALIDDRTQLYMVVKSWLNTMVGIDRLFLLFVTKISELPFIASVNDHGAGEKATIGNVVFNENDDIELCLYYLRSLQHVLRCTGEVTRAVLASKYLYFGGGEVHLRAGAEDNEMTLQEYLVRVCLQCITADVANRSSVELVDRVSQLHRYALAILHQFLSSRYATSLSGLQLDGILIDRLLKSIGESDPYVQVLLLDVIYDVLKLQDMAPAEIPTSPMLEKTPPSLDRPRPSRQSISMSESRPIAPPMPPQLLKCLQAGLSAASSHAVLDSWVAFLADCLPFYSQSIFQALIPLVETLCRQIGQVFASLRNMFKTEPQGESLNESAPEATLIYLLNGLEQVLALAHDQLLAAESRAQIVKGPEQPQSLFGSMVSGVFQSDGPQARSATANDRLTVHLAFQDAMRICFRIWSWGEGDEAKTQDQVSAASFTYTSLRMRNRARRLLEHLFAAETLECLETVIDIWTSAESTGERALVFSFLSALDACRPRHSIPALFNSIYSRTNPGALEPSRKSTMTISLQDSDLVAFLVEYARSLDDDAMDEIWQDCMTFLKDLLGNPFPHRQTLPSLLEFAAILGEKVDNTTFGEQRRMRRELGDLFLRLLAALFTTRPITFSEPTHSNGTPEKAGRDGGHKRAPNSDGPEGVVAVLASVAPNLPKILVEYDRVLAAANTVSSSTMTLLRELSRLQNNQKAWKKDVGDAFNDPRFFGMRLDLVTDDWLPLLRQWILTDKEKMPEITSRISAPTTAGIVFGVGATSARLEADRKTQLNLRRIATLILASAEDAFVTDLGTIFDKLVELMAATATSSPSSTTRADVFMVVRALVLKTSPVHLALLWPVVNAEMHAAISSVVAPDHSTASDIYVNTAIFQACKLLDLLICVAPDDFQLHEWLFVTDTIDAVYPPSTYQPIALADELSEELGSSGAQGSAQTDTAAHLAASSSHRRPLLGSAGLGDQASFERRDELVAKVLRPFFGQLSIFAFESTYAMSAVDMASCVQDLLKDIFDERTMVRAL